MANLGDIVRLNGFDWVVAGYEPSPTAQLVRLLRPNYLGLWAAHITGKDGLQVLETPEWAIGQKVWCGGLAAQITDFTEDTATITYDPFRVEIPGGGHFLLTGHRSDIPLWQLTLENHHASIA